MNSLVSILAGHDALLSNHNVFGGNRMILPRKGSSNEFATKSQTTEMGEELSDETVPDKKNSKKRAWKKPKDRPKRPLSAYNLFFQSEREKIVRANGGVIDRSGKRRRREQNGVRKIGFANLARDIAQKWKAIDPESLIGFEAQADVEKQRYKKEMEEWNKKRATKQGVGSDILPDNNKSVPSSRNNGRVKSRKPSPNKKKTLPTIQLPECIGSGSSVKQEPLSPEDHLKMLLTALETARPNPVTPDRPTPEIATSADVDTENNISPRDCTDLLCATLEQSVSALDPLDHTSNKHDALDDFDSMGEIFDENTFGTFDD